MSRATSIIGLSALAWKCVARSLAVIAIAMASLDASAIVAFEGTLTTAQQRTMPNRFLRFGSASDCGVAKAYPGMTNTGGFAYDTKTAAHFGPAKCVGVVVSASCSSGSADMFYALYVGSFDPANPRANYIGDSGDSFGSAAAQFGITSVDLPAGATLVIVPVLIAPSNGPLVSCSYTISVDVTTGPALDIDANGKVDPLTDGLLGLRYLFGLRGTALLFGAMGQGANRSTSTLIEDYLKSLVQ